LPPLTPKATFPLPQRGGVREGCKGCCLPLWILGGVGAWIIGKG